MRLLPTTLAAQIYLNIVSFHLLPLPFFFPFFKQRRRGAQRERGYKVAAADTQRCQALLIETSRSLPDKQRKRETEEEAGAGEQSRLRGSCCAASLTRSLPCVCVCAYACVSARGFQGLSLQADCARVAPLPASRQSPALPRPSPSSDSPLFFLSATS